MHVQEPVNDWLQAVTRLPAKALVKATSVQWLSEAKAANAGIYTCHRYVNDPLQDVNPDDTDEIRASRARDWFNRFIDDTFLNQQTAGIPHWQATNFVSWWNEYYANGQTWEHEAFWRQERIAAKVWRDEYRNGPNKAKLGHIRLTIAAAPVGNDIPWQTAETAKIYDCVVDYHPYKHYTALNTVDPGDWQYHSGRWNTMDVDFRNRGFTVNWIFGECGPYQAAETGWRSDVCLGGNAAAYVESMRAWIRNLATTNAYQTGRLLGFALFTTGGGDRWRTFETKQPELNDLADMIKAEWKPGAVIPPSNSLPITPLSQRDPRWSSHIMGADATGRVRTIGDFGCLVTDWCMMIRQWGISQMNPAELWEHIKATGGTNGAYLKSGSLAAAFPGKVKYNGYTGGGAGLYDLIRANKDKGWITPVRVDFNPSTPQQEEHWVNVIDYLPDDNFTAADPWTGKIITINLVYGIPGPDVLAAQWYEPITSAPPPPRKYKRVCHLLPQDATPAEYDRVTSEAYALRQSVMSSIDDALITHPNLTSRTVNVWGELSRHGDFTDKASFENWVNSNYPPLPVINYRTF